MIKYTCKEWRKIIVVDKTMEFENESVYFCKVLASPQDWYTHSRAERTGLDHKKNRLGTTEYMKKQPIPQISVIVVAVTTTRLRSVPFHVDVNYYF